MLLYNFRYYVFLGTVLLSLTEKYCRETGMQTAFKGYAIYPVTSKDPKVLDAKFFSKTEPCFVLDAVLDIRSVYGMHKLPPGDYCIVVFTQPISEKREFLLRIFSEKPLA